MRNRKVVIIDDDRKSLGYLEEILAASGYDSVLVSDALLAVDIVVQRNPDAILLDLEMPSKNGFELANEINHIFETQRIPIIAMSSLLKNSPFPLMSFCRINRYLKKPFNPLDVIWALENVIEENHQSEKEIYSESVEYKNYDIAGRSF